MEYRILVTGSRTWIDTEAIHVQLERHHSIAVNGGFEPVLVSGACPKGADYAAEVLWHMHYTGRVERHPADWSKGRGAGFIRNQHMVDLGANVCLAFIKNGSKGASHTAKAAEEAGIPTVRVEA